MAVGSDKPLMARDPQTSAACPTTSLDAQFPLRIWVLHMEVYRWTNPNGGENGGRIHSQAKRHSPLGQGLITALRSASTLMLSVACQLKVASEIFGHGSVAITGDDYGQVSPKVSREALTPWWRRRG